MVSDSPAPFLSSAALPDLLQAALEISLTGFVLFRPLYRAADPLTITDLAYEHLNPAAQRISGLPERPAESFLTNFPHAVDTGVFAFYCDTFLAGQASRYDVNYQGDSLDNYFQLTARRVGDLLLVSFTDTSDHARTPVEIALRESQAAERAARQQVEQLNQELEARVEERTRSLSRAQAEVLAVTQQQVQQRETLYQVFEQTPAMVQLLRGPHHHVEYVNPAYQRLFPGRPLVGLDLAEAVPELREQGFIAILDGVYQTGETYFGLEVPLLIEQPAGQPPRTGYFTFTYQPYHEKGQLVGVSLLAHEVSEQALARLEQDAQREQVRVLLEREAQREQIEHLNEELAAINEELQATNEELGDSNQQLTRVNIDLDNFIYTASHDLKAPISNIEGLLFLLREDLPADVAQAPHIFPTLTLMLGAVERFKRTIEHLTEVTKLQKEHARATVSVDLAAVVEDVLLDLAPLLREANTQLRVEVSNFPLVRFSEKNLRSVVYNLLSNALKYRHPDRRPHIDVQAHVRPGYTILEVHDNGLGLDEVQLPRLFNLFQRFHSHVEGTGIGLYMVKRMVENAGGRIEVHSRPEGGTTFFVYLPTSAPPRA